MAVNLSAGAIQLIATKQPCQKPVVQIISVKQINAPNADQSQSERFRLVVSDGEHYQQAMLATQLNELVKQGVVQARCVIRLNEYLCNIIHGRRIVIILSLDQICPPLDDTIGKPVSIDSVIDGKPNAASPPQPQHQQQQQQQQYAKNDEYQYQQQSHQPQQYQQQQQHQQQYKTELDDQYHQQHQHQHQQQQQHQRYAPQQQSHYSSNNGMPSSSPVHVYPIKSLNPYQNKWIIKARVTNKSDMKTWNNAKGSGKLFNVDLVDAQGGEIRASMFGEAAEQLFNVFEPDRVYLISKGQLKFKNKRFNPTPHEYEITLDLSSQVDECADEASIPKMQFNFVPIASIIEYQSEQVVDIIGVITAIGDLVSIHTKTGRDIDKRSFTVADDSNGGTSIDVALWGAPASKFEAAVGTVLAVKGARVSDYNGKTLSAMNSSHIERDPDRKEAHRLRGWFSERGGQVHNTLTQSTYRGGGGESGQRREQMMTFDEIKVAGLGHNKMDYATVKATVAVIKHETDPWYPSCPNVEIDQSGNQRQCQKKVSQGADGNWVCDKCSHVAEHPNYRYILTLRASDHTGTNWISLFNDSAALLLGQSADEMKHLKSTNTAAYESYFGNAQWRDFRFRLRCKAEEYMEETRVKFHAMTITPLNYAEESRSLIEKLRRYH